MTTSRFAIGLVIATLAATGCQSSDNDLGPTPTLVRLTPEAAAVGTTLTVTGSGFGTSGNAVRIGGGYLRNLRSTDGSTISFTLPANLEVCGPGTQVCAAVALEVLPGTYDVAVVSRKGVESNTASLTVTE